MTKHLANFLEVSLTEEKAKEIVEKSSFHKMKENGKNCTYENFKKLRQIVMREGKILQYSIYEKKLSLAPFLIFYASTL